MQTDEDVCTVGTLHVKFRTAQGHYLYDSVTNRIFRVRKPVYDAVSGSSDMTGVIEGHPQRPLELGLTESARTVGYLRNYYGALQETSIPERGAKVSEEELRYVLENNGIDGCSLEVTQQCNFRCFYCVHSGGYSDQRPHRARNMSWRVAKAAVDMYLSANRHRSTEEHLGLGFFGGEPLLRRDLIRRVIDYASSHPLAAGRDIYYHTTTNRSLLIEDIVDYMQRIGFGLIVSLDGPAVHHDRNRVFRNGTPTFSAVVARLARIQKRFPEYYRRHVAFAVVLAPESRLTDISEFFDTHPLFQGQSTRLRVTGVAPGNPSYFDCHRPYAERGEDRQSALRTFLASRISGCGCSAFVRELFQSPYLRLHRRSLSGPNQGAAPPAYLPICVPGQRKVFVSSAGTLHVCEKVGEHFQIGTVTSGLDVPRIHGLFSKYYAFANRLECRTCWAHRFCSACFATMHEAGDDLRLNSPDACGIVKAGLLEKMQGYCSVAEQNPHAWDYLDAYGIV